MLFLRSMRNGCATGGAPLAGFLSWASSASFSWSTPDAASAVPVARTVTLREGRVPLLTLRADIDFSRTEAGTTYGQIGVKVWVYHGDMKTEVEEKVETTEGVYVSE